jgi:predicted HD phosphohydrolase
MDVHTSACKDLATRKTDMQTTGTHRPLFRTLDEATPDDWREIIRAEAAARLKRTTGDRLLDLLASIRGDDSLGSPVNLYVHSLQTATRVLRAGEDDELVVVALFHDLPEAFSDNHHGLVAAELLSPWISERRTWLLVQHVDFQLVHFVNHPTADTHARDCFIGHTFYAETAHFCEYYDQNSFDSNYPTLPLQEFVPIVRRFFARPRPSLKPVRLA